MPHIFNSPVKSFTRIIDEMNDYYEVVESVFNRNGWYYDRLLKRSWTEFNGLAWLDKNIDGFLFEFSIANHKALSSIERNAIQTLINRNNCPKSLRLQLETDNHRLNFRKITLQRLKAIIRFKEFHRSFNND